MRRSCTPGQDRHLNVNPLSKVRPHKPQEFEKEVTRSGNVPLRNELAQNLGHVLAPVAPRETW